MLFHHSYFSSVTVIYKTKNRRLKKKALSNKHFFTEIKTK